MKKLFLLILFSVLNVSCNSSEYLVVQIPDKKLKGDLGTLTYDGKIFTGEVISYYNNQNLRWKGVHKDGKLLEYYTFWEDGSQKTITFYNEGVLGRLELHKNGKDISYYKNGQLEYERTYRNNKLEGELEYSEDGELIKKLSRVDGKREGEYFLRTGTYTIKGSYKNDVEVGTWVEDLLPGKRKEYRWGGRPKLVDFPGKKIINEYDNGFLIKTDTIIGDN